MKTIAFLSYKGGVGRTYAAANIAVLLARCGKSVVLADFDFNGPGLLHKFGKSPFSDVERGFVDFASFFMPDPCNAVKEAIPLTKCLLEPIHVHCRDKGGREGKIIIMPSGNAGDEAYWDLVFSPGWASFFDLRTHCKRKLQFFFDEFKGAIKQMGVDYLLIDAMSGISPPGGASAALLADTCACFFVNNPENLDGTKRIVGALSGLPTASSPEGEGLSLPHRVTTRATDNANAQGRTGTIEETVRRSGESSPFLLRIATRLATSVGRVLDVANSLSFSLVRSRGGGKRGLPLDGDASSCNHTRQKPRIVLVLSRVPFELQRALRPNLRDEIESEIRPPGSECEFEALQILHSCMDVEVEEHLVVTPDGIVQSYDLTRELVELLGALCPELALDSGLDAGSEREVLSFLWDLMRFPGDPNVVGVGYRVFRYSGALGMMTNLEDGRANVSFKVDTFCGILQDLHRDQMQRAVDATDAAATIDKNTILKVDSRFRAAGRQTGCRFGEDLCERVWGETAASMSWQDRLDRWCKFDSSVGFGRMNAVIKERKESESTESEIKGRVHVLHNFLARPGKLTERGLEVDLCGLLTGYIEGVLSAIMAPFSEVTVTHEHSQCASYLPAKEDDSERNESEDYECVFDFACLRKG